MSEKEKIDWKWIEDQLARSDEDSVEEMQYAESSTLTEAAHNEGQAAPSNIAGGEDAADKDEGEVHREEVGDTSTGQMKYPKAGEAIQIKEKGVWQNAQVLGRGGKASSRLHAGYFNLMVDSQKIGVYLDRMEWRRVGQSEDENIPQRKKHAAQENGEGGEDIDLEGESTSSEGTTEDETFDDEF